MTDPYRAHPAVNWSSLKLLRDSPLAYRHNLAQGRADTPALALGRITHTLVFEPDQFEAEYAIWDGGRRGTNAYKEFEAEHAGKTIFKPSEIDEAVAMADAVRRHPLVQPYLVGGQFEQPLYWTDPDTGIECKARPDWVQPEREVLIDLKTAQSIEGRALGRAAARYGYHCQLAHYAAGVTHALGWKPREVLIIAVEKSAPYDVGIFEIDAEAMYAAREEVADLLHKLKYHRKTDQWPGRYTEPQALQLPPWVFESDDEDDAFGLVVGRK